MMTPEQAKEFVKNHFKKIKEQGFQPNLNDLNDCIVALRNQGFYVTVDNTCKIIGDVMMDGNANGQFNFETIGEIRV